MNRFDNIIDTHNKAIPIGITSICTANPYVIRAAMQQLRSPDEFLLIEATCNQVNQYGGYSGKTPRDFAADVFELARQSNILPQQIVLGGDHLGPYVWRKEPADEAMKKATKLVQAYVEAGFTKIHLDTSMLLGDDKAHEGMTETFALRTAELAKAAEETAERLDRKATLRYVVGNEVPLPGGAGQSQEVVHVSDVEDTRMVIESTRQAFYRLGLQDAWERVIAIVVQPGVEFGNDAIIEYDRRKAVGLSKLIEAYAGLIYEAHSTDYQTAVSLRQLVEDHFAILKVGPALTFAFREAVFALAMMEEELSLIKAISSVSNIREVLDRAMLQNPLYWQPYYTGDQHQQAFSRKFSLSDRCRYYWQVEEVQNALARLVQNLESVSIPLSLLSQYMPLQYHHVRQGQLSIKPDALIMDHINRVLEDYAYACSSNGG